MNELTPLLEKLAENLGTTTEYLWGILMKQAMISAISDLIFMAIVAVAGYYAFKAHVYMSGKEEGEYDNRYEDNLALAIGVVVIIGAVFICSIGAISSIPNIINGFFHPEFWAFDYIMDILR